MNAALDITLYILSALAGLVFGSFLNVVIYRLPRGEFFSNARSYCPRCKAKIRFYDNIPVFSYIFLRGKCRNCGERISVRYPLVELLNCALWVGNYAAFGMSGTTLIWDIAVSVLVVATFIDLDICEIPDSGVLLLLVLGLITFAPFGGVTWQDKLIGCVCVSVPMLVVFFFGGMGLGDVKLYFVLGLLLGWQKILIVFLVSVVTGAAAALIWLAAKRAKGKDKAYIDGDVEQKYDKIDIAENGGAECGTPVNGAKNVCISDTDGDISGADGADKTIGAADGGNAVTAYGARIADGCETAFAADKAYRNSAKNDVLTADTGKEKEDFSQEGEQDGGEEDGRGRWHAIPFGPFIAIGTLVALYGGDAIIGIYSRFLGI